MHPHVNQTGLTVGLIKWMDWRVDGSEQMPQQPVPVTAVVKVTASRDQIGTMIVIIIAHYRAR